MQFDPLNPVLPLLQREKRKDKLGQILFTTLNTQKQFNSWSLDIDFYKACYTALSWQRALSINTPFHKNDGHPIFFRSIEDDVQTLVPRPPGTPGFALAVRNRFTPSKTKPLIFRIPACDHRGSGPFHYIFENHKGNIAYVNLALVDVAKPYEYLGVFIELTNSAQLANCVLLHIEWPYGPEFRLQDDHLTPHFGYLFLLVVKDIAKGNTLKVFDREVVKKLALNDLSKTELPPEIAQARIDVLTSPGLTSLSYDAFVIHCESQRGLPVKTDSITPSKGRSSKKNITDTDSLACSDTHSDFCIEYQPRDGSSSRRSSTSSSMVPCVIDAEGIIYQIMEQLPADVMSALEGPLGRSSSALRQLRSHNADGIKVIGYAVADHRPRPTPQQVYEVMHSPKGEPYLLYPQFEAFGTSVASPSYSIPVAVDGVNYRRIVEPVENRAVLIPGVGIAYDVMGKQTGWIPESEANKLRRGKDPAMKRPTPVPTQEEPKIKKKRAPSPPVCEEPVSTVPETPIVVSQVVDSVTPVPDIVAVLEPVVETVLSVTEPVVVETAPEPTAVTAVVPEPVVIPDTVPEPVPEPVVVPVKPPRRPIWG